MLSLLKDPITSFTFWTRSLFCWETLQWPILQIRPTQNSEKSFNQASWEARPPPPTPPQQCSYRCFPKLLISTMERPAQCLETVPAPVPSCWFILAGMGLFVFISVSVDSWDGFSEKKCKKRLFCNATVKHWTRSGNIAATLYNTLNDVSVPSKSNNQKLFFVEGQWRRVNGTKSRIRIRTKFYGSTTQYRGSATLFSMNNKKSDRYWSNASNSFLLNKE